MGIPPNSYRNRSYFGSFLKVSPFNKGIYIDFAPYHSTKLKGQEILSFILVPAKILEWVITQLICGHLEEKVPITRS